MTIKFGPAGLGPVKRALDRLEEYHKLGLSACEIAFTYGVYIKPDEAMIIGKKAKELGIDLSIHAQYWVNLNSQEKEKVEASKKRIIDCCEIGELLGAKIVVFHPGYYSTKGKGKNKEIDYELSYQNIKSQVVDMVNIIKANKWKIQIAPETMGKVNVFGNIDEISRLSNETGCAFCIDFAHILARYKAVDYNKIISSFPQDNWHCHFSGIVYGDKGEKHHISTDAKSWIELLKNIPKNKNIRIINESPTFVKDSVDALSIWNKLNK